MTAGSNKQRIRDRDQVNRSLNIPTIQTQSRITNALGDLRTGSSYLSNDEYAKWNAFSGVFNILTNMFAEAHADKIHEARRQKTKAEARAEAVSQLSGTLEFADLLPSMLKYARDNVGKMSNEEFKTSVNSMFNERLSKLDDMGKLAYQQFYIKHMPSIIDEFNIKTEAHSEKVAVNAWSESAMFQINEMLKKDGSPLSSIDFDEDGEPMMIGRNIIELITDLSHTANAVTMGDQIKKNTLITSTLLNFIQSQPITDEGLERVRFFTDMSIDNKLRQQLNLGVDDKGLSNLDKIFNMADAREKDIEDKIEAVNEEKVQKNRRLAVEETKLKLSGVMNTVAEAQPEDRLNVTQEQIEVLTNYINELESDPNIDINVTKRTLREMYREQRSNLLQSQDRMTPQDSNRILAKAIHDMSHGYITPQEARDILYDRNKLYDITEQGKALKEYQARVDGEKAPFVSEFQLQNNRLLQKLQFNGVFYGGITQTQKGLEPTSNAARDFFEDIGREADFLMNKYIAETNMITDPDERNKEMAKARIKFRDEFEKIVNEKVSDRNKAFAEPFKGRDLKQIPVDSLYSIATMDEAQLRTLPKDVLEIVKPFLKDMKIGGMDKASGFRKGFFTEVFTKLDTTQQGEFNSILKRNAIDAQMKAVDEYFKKEQTQEEYVERRVKELEDDKAYLYTIEPDEDYTERDILMNIYDIEYEIDMLRGDTSKYEIPTGVKVPSILEIIGGVFK